MKRLKQLIHRSMNASRRKTRTRTGLFEVQALEVRQLLAADVEILKDIQPGATNSVTGQPVELNGKIYFAASDGTNGEELWVSDGLSGGTAMLKDLRTGSAGSFPTGLFTTGGKLYFHATNSSGQRGLWVSDGTANGTTQLSTTDLGQYFGSIGSTLFFYRSGVRGNSGAFYKSDGTASGTVRLADGFPETGMKGAVVFDGTIFVSTSDTSQSLRTMNATTGVMTPVSGSPAEIQSIHLAGTKLFLIAADNLSQPRRLWKLDTAASTPVSIQPADSAALARNPTAPVAFAGAYYFSAHSEADGVELWKTDGTAAGTNLVKDISSGVTSSQPAGLSVVGTKLYFAATGSAGRELWVTDGTTDGTVLVSDLSPGATASDPIPVFNDGTLLFFAARTSDTTGPFLFSTNGTSAGTTAVNSLKLESAEGPAARLGTSAVFPAQNSTYGRELFIYRSGTQLTPPLLSGPATTSSMRPTISWNSVSSATGYEVWIRNRSTGLRQVYQTVTGTSFTPSSDLGIGQFTVWVRAISTSGEVPSAWSHPLNFRIKAAVTSISTAPHPTTGLTQISWAALPGAARYDVWVNRLDVATSQAFRNQNVTGTSVTPSLPNGQYRVWVRGLAADGTDGAWSASFDFTAVQVPGIISSRNPTLNISPTVTWTAVPGAATYEFYILNTANNTKVLHQKNISATSFTWSGIPAGQYRYWVRVAGATVWSAPVDVDTRGRTVVAPPTNVPTQTHFSWQTVDNTIRYELWINRIGVQNKYIDQRALTSPEYTHPGTLPAGTYRVWVRAIGDTVTGAWSQSIDFTVAAAPASLPSDSELLASVFADSELGLFPNERPTAAPTALVRAEVPASEESPATSRQSPAPRPPEQSSIPETPVELLQELTAAVADTQWPDMTSVS